LTHPTQFITIIFNKLSQIIEKEERKHRRIPEKRQRRRRRTGQHRTDANRGGDEQRYKPKNNRKHTPEQTNTDNSSTPSPSSRGKVNEKKEPEEKYTKGGERGSIHAITIVLLPGKDMSSSLLKKLVANICERRTVNFILYIYIILYE
jgi:hypothetical protein